MPVISAQSDQLNQIEDALVGSAVTGWDVLAAIVVLVASVPVSALVRRLTVRLVRRVPNLPDEVARLAGRLARWTVLLVGVAWSLSIIGVDVGWVVVVVAIALIVAVLMVRPLVENAAAGLSLTARSVFAEGDQIETGGYRGTVEEIRSRSTVLRTNDGRRIHIPNTEVVGQPITVYTASPSRKAGFDISLTRTADLDRATQLLLKATSEVDGVQQDPAPTVQASALTADAITLAVDYWYPSTMTSDSSVTDGVIRAVEKALAGAGIELAAPALAIDISSPATAEDDHDPKQG
jgi:small conductance mechanosensitive channel